MVSEDYLSVLGVLDSYVSSREVPGINAGVMLFTPNAEEFARSFREVQCARHPEYISGAAPEQDYPSRFYESSWTHIEGAFNYQPHHVFIVLEVGDGTARPLHCPLLWGVEDVGQRLLLC